MTKQGRLIGKIAGLIFFTMIPFSFADSGAGNGILESLLPRGVFLRLVALTTNDPSASRTSNQLLELHKLFPYPSNDDPDLKALEKILVKTTMEDLDTNYIYQPEEKTITVRLDYFLSHLKIIKKWLSLMQRTLQIKALSQDEHTAEVWTQWWIRYEFILENAHLSKQILDNNE